MAKRPLGLGKAHEKKNKKKKTSNGEDSKHSSKEQTPQNDGQLMIKLNSDMNELAQLWVNYVKKKIANETQEEGDQNELVLNGIIHECDRILRKSHNLKENKDSVKDDEESIIVDGQLYAIYGLALAELAYFQSQGEDDDEEEEKEFDEEEEKKKNSEHAAKISEFFTEALDRIETGFDKFPKDRITLNWAKIQILANRIPLQYISSMTLTSNKKKYPDIEKLVDELFSSYQDNMKLASNLSSKNAGDEYNDYGVFFDYQQYLVLDTIDDLLDMIENFGMNDDLNEIDSDNEDEIETSNIELTKKHPLFVVRDCIPSYEDNLIEKCENFLEHLQALDKSKFKIDIENSCQNSEYKHNSLVIFYLQINKKLGELYLRKADGSGKAYTDIVYGDDQDSEPSVPKKELQKLQKEAIANYKKAIEHIKKIEDPEDPQTWVNIAEAEISLGNIYDLDSKDQETLYQKAEKRLKKANKATNGKYDHILKNLLDG
ncbi:Ett1 protein [Saccharomycopsis crataegensis]|uniref:Enhancer of translation termination 1 n=1 Tax=Saccharomycopsis crataegensis TaxID=43959 RepID=A0AAV5QMY2_9ASCO|nr:Ett1 protein [Saccharomycopsis crataegensis]